MLKVWGRLNSINVQKVVLALEEIGLPYERVDAGLQFGINTSPEYLAMNPMGLIPTIDDDGFLLWESNAITRYLCAKHATGGLYPTDLHERADAERWMDWQGGALNTAMVPAFYNLVRAPADKRNDAAIEASRVKTNELVAMLEAHLAGRDYVAGATYGIGDIGMVPIMHRWLNLPLERTPIPNIEAWYHRLMQRPACQRVLTLPLS